MCVALLCPPKVRPSMPLLQACHRANPHGAGIAWRERGRIHWRKGLGVCDVHQLANEKPGEILIHFRWASVGRVDPLLCHPFPVTADAELKLSGVNERVLFHNGTWSNYTSAIETVGDLEGLVSDTRVAAAFVHHVGAKPLNRLPGRWAVMERSEIKLFGDWLPYKGMLVTNGNFERYSRQVHDRRESTGSARAHAHNIGRIEVFSRVERVREKPRVYSCQMQTSEVRT